MNKSKLQIEDKLQFFARKKVREFESQVFESNLSADQQILDYDDENPDDQEQASQTFDQAEVLDNTNSDGNVNPEAKHPEGKKKVMRVYESLQERNLALMIVQKETKYKKNQLKVGEVSTKEDYYFVWNEEDKKQWIVSMEEEGFEEIQYSALPKRLK